MGSHYRPTLGYLGRTELFDFRDLTGMKPQSAILGHAKDLVRIEVVGSLIPRLAARPSSALAGLMLRERAVT